MRILQVNKFLRPFGGAESVLFRTADLLQRRGHNVRFFGMADEVGADGPRAAVSELDLDDQRSLQAAWQDGNSLVSNVDLHLSGGWRALMRPQTWGTAARILHSREAARKMEALADSFKPDIVHLHNIYHQLSPSILAPLRKRNIPTVLSLADYKLICPNYSLFVDGAVCERCRGHRYYEAVLHRCVKGSLAQSALCAAEAYAHHASGAYARGIDAFIACSHFIARKVTDFGYDAGSIVHLPNFIDHTRYTPDYGFDNSFVFVGRVEAVKGVSTLVEAVRGSEVARDFVLKIGGDGELREPLARQCSDAGAGNIQFLGRVPRETATSLIKDSMFMVLPSEWYENAPVSILEAYVLGKPVIASRIGGMPEIVEEGRTGLLFEPGDAADLRRKIEHLLANPSLALEMGKNARAYVEREHSPESHYLGLMEIYERAIEAHGYARSTARARS